VIACDSYKRNGNHGDVSGMESTDERWERWRTATPAEKVLQTRSRSGFDVAVHKVANYAT